MRLEEALGDPERAENLLSFRNALEWDEQELFPEPAIQRLLHLGVHTFNVPEELGGRFRSMETLVAMARTVARRNMSVAVSISPMVWTMLAWMGAGRELQGKLARAVLQEGEFPCLAYSEEAHGSDLLANETTAEPQGDRRYAVTGRKWPINRATRSQWVVLLARTRPSSHPRNHSLFIFEKARLDRQSYRHLSPVKTHGLRGCDISGIAFEHCLLPDGALIGGEGDGLELALKGFQITRTLCTGLSLGVADSALRLTNNAASGRRLYGRPVIELPHARDTLANAYVSSLIGECASVAAARGLHLFPEQGSVWSSVAKVQVVRLADEAVQQLGGILGARAFLREGTPAAAFQKFLRDGAIVAVFDGSSIVCLERIAALLPRLCREQRGGPDESLLGTLFDIRRPLPAMDFSRLTLRWKGGDAVLGALPALERKLGQTDPDRECGADCLEELKRQTRALRQAVQELRDEARTAPEGSSERNSAARMGLAERYCELHTAICCLGYWLFNRDHQPGFAAAGDWLRAALARGGEARFRCGRLRPEVADSLCARLQEQTQQMFTLLPWPLALRGAAELER